MAFSLQGCGNRLNFAASISETTPELTLQMFVVEVKQH